MRLLVVRPQVGADATAARAAALGHDAVVAPLFAYRALAWDAPPAFDPDVLLLTSAAAVRLGGAGLRRYRALPVFAVGTATADAARLAGFRVVGAGTGDARSAIAALAGQGYRRALHPAGRDHVAVDPGPLAVRHVPVYAADAVDRLPDPIPPALAAGAIVLLHSPRAARTFAALLRDHGHAVAAIRIACFSRAVADGAGPGWAGVAIAARPTDTALFAAAAMLCDQGAGGMTEQR